jgi:GNAT superfamily N-acetyltransferase
VRFPRTRSLLVVYWWHTNIRSEEKSKMATTTEMPTTTKPKPAVKTAATPSTNELVVLGAPVALRDGSHVRVRQGHRSDKELLLRGFERLSRESRYRRFLAPMSELSEVMVRYLSEVDHHDHEAIVALDEETGEGIGVVRYVRSTERPDAAEFAVTVTDDWQRRGLGTLLLEVISARAREEGITTFTALMLASNQEMMDVLEHLGPVRIVDRDAGTVEIEMPIPAVGLSPALSKLLRIAACNDVAVFARRSPRPAPRPTPRGRGRQSTDRAADSQQQRVLERLHRPSRSHPCRAACRRD